MSCLQQSKRQTGSKRDLPDLWWVVLEIYCKSTAKKSPQNIQDVFRFQTDQSVSCRLFDENFTVSCSSADLHEAFLNADKKREIKRGQLQEVETRKVVTIDSLCDEFIHCRSFRKPDTVEMFRSMCNRIRGYVLDHFTGQKLSIDKKVNAVPKLVNGDDYIHLLTQEQFDSFVRKMQTIVAVGTLRTFLTRVNTMYEYAKEEGYAVPDVNFKKHNMTLAEPDL